MINKLNYTPRTIPMRGAAQPERGLRLRALRQRADAYERFMG